MLLGAVILSLVAIVAGCEEKAGGEQQAARPVKVTVVETPNSGRTVTYSGVVRPRIESAVGFRVAGKIVERRVNAGDRVEAGQVIARLDDTDLKLAENSAKATVGTARTRRDVASDHLERAKVLLPRSFIAKAVYDSRRNEMDAAASALESAEAQLHQATNAVDYATLRADNAGTVTAVTAEPGQVVSAGQTVIMLAKAGETEIAVVIPEQDAGRLTVGQPAKVTLWAGPRVSTEGKIREIAGQADAASRTYAIRIAVRKPPELMRYGMTASVAIRIDDDAPQVVVPLPALTESDGKPVVFIVDPAVNTVRKTLVTVGGIADNGVKISAGLHVGDVVVTAGVQFLRDGMPVRLPGGHRAGRLERSS
jgi:RND family efflux transporter MFP subunit